MCTETLEACAVQKLVGVPFGTLLPYAEELEKEAKD
jgi:hypothetical protein